jgi:hypothetical protein
MIRFRMIFACLLTLTLGACAVFTYDGTEHGRLKGQLLVIWVGEDRFVYWPKTKDPLTFTLAPALQSKLGISTIRPGLMYTDGGSIPRALRAFDGFSPWGYGPAYIMHDWIFAAHHCLVQGRPDPKEPEEYEKVKRFTFDDSAELLAEVMKTLMVDQKVRTKPDVFNAISFGVDSVVARNLWDSTDPKSCDPVTDEDIRKIEGALKTKRLNSFALGSGAPKNPPLIVYSQPY